MKQDPYVGPRPYEREDRRKFYGRDREARELRSLIVAEREVLFYAQSGAGKTSLLNARVIPELEEKGFNVLPVARVGSEVPPGIASEDVDNVFVFSVLTTLAGEGAPSATLLHQTLRSFLESFCQEEGEATDGRPPVLIFDQFEELFTTHRDRWQDAQGFFLQVREVLDALPRLGVVFAMREDHVAELDPYLPLFPRRLRARFRMERLRKRAALAAVEGPLADTERAFDEGVAEQLVEELLKARVTTAAGETEVVTGQFVEPVQLQVVCQSLWRSLPAAVTVITQDHLEAFGDVNQALSGFYERSIKRAAPRAGVKEGELREWFERVLVTPAGTRGTVYRGRDETGGVPNPVVDELQNLHLIRGEWRSGARWYELSHDRFIGPIQRSNETWRAARRARWLRVGGGVAAALVLLTLALAGTVAWLQGRVVRTVLQSDATATAASELQVTATAAQSEFQGTATAVAADSADLAASVTRARVRPLKPGLSVSGVNVTAGTIGAFVRDARGELYLLSASSVLGLLDDRPGSPVVQPGAMDGGQEPGDVVGYLARGLSLADGVPMAHLVGMARLEEGVTFEMNVPGIGPIRGVCEPTLGAPVRMLGRTSGLATGEITRVDVAMKIGLGKETLLFVNGIATSPMSGPGDSGALMVDEEGCAIGIEVAGSPSMSLFAPLQDVLDSLDVELVVPGQELLTLEGHDGAVLSAAWSPDGRRIVTASDDGSAIVWDVATGRALLILKGHAGSVLHAAWNSDGTRIVTASDDWNAIVWDATTGEALLTLSGHAGPVVRAAWSPDGRRIVTASDDGSAIVWNAATGRELFTLSGHTASVVHAAWSPDGTRIVTASADGSAIVWDATAGAALRTLSRHTNSVRYAAWSSQGTHIVTASDDGSAIVWDAATGRALFLKGHRGSVLHAAWNSGDTRIVTTSDDWTAIVWDAMTGEALLTLGRHVDSVLHAAWSPDGTRIVTASDDGNAIVWDAASGVPLFPLSGHTSSVVQAAWSPDGTRIVTASADGTAGIWQAR